MVKKLSVSGPSTARIVFFLCLVAFVGASGVFGTQEQVVERTVTHTDTYDGLDKIVFVENMTTEERSVVEEFQSSEEATVTNPSEGHFLHGTIGGSRIAVIENQTVTKMYVNQPVPVWSVLLIILAGVLVASAWLSSNKEEGSSAFEVVLTIAGLLFAIWVVFFL